MQPDASQTQVAKSSPRISVVIPCGAHETKSLRLILPSLRDLPGVHEILIADASKTHACLPIASVFGARTVECREPTRGQQLNNAISKAEGELILILFLENELTRAHFDALQHIAHEEKRGGGTYARLRETASPGWKWLEFLAGKLNERSGLSYSGQPIFVRHEIFKKMGGFKKIPFFEDLDFCVRMWRITSAAVLGPPIYSSTRRFNGRTTFEITLENLVLVALLKIGVSPPRLRRWQHLRRNKEAGVP